MIATFALLLVLAVDAPDTSGSSLPQEPSNTAEAGGSAPGAPGDTLTRVPGSPLRLGWTQERTSALGPFAQRSANEGVTVRRGDVRWFGTTAQATLTYRDGRLAAVRLESAKPTPALLSYAPDELRRAGYRRVSHVIDPGTDRSEWIGPGTITLTASATSLIAEVKPRGAAAASVAASAPPSPPASAASTSPPAGGPGAPPPSATPGTGTLVASEAGAGAGEVPAGALPGEIDFTATGTDSLPAPRVVATPPPPVRPRIAVDAGLFGRVQVRARIDTTGRVVHAEIARGIAEFNSAALAWAADVRYEPYRVNGRPVPVVVTIPVVFAPQRTNP